MNQNHISIENLDIYGEQVREVLSRPPHRLIQVSSSLIFIFLVVLFSLSYVIKYPDILNARIVITARNRIKIIKHSLTKLYILGTIRQKCIISEKMTEK